MTDRGDGTTLAFDEVVQRFADSAQALEAVREKLDALASAETTQASAAQGLQEASAKLAQFIETAAHLVGQAEGAQKVAREVLQAGAGLIDGTDLKALQSGMASTSNTVTDGLARIEQLIGDTRTRDQKIAELDAELARRAQKITELDAELARRTATLSGRQRKSLGITH